MDYPAPAYGTTRDPRFPTVGYQVARVAVQLGTPLLPWQRYVADVALEKLGDRWRYPTVVLLVPRQAGKTALLRAVIVHRALTTSNKRLYMTAQHGKDAAQRWADIVEAVALDPILGKVTKLRRSQGSQAMSFPTGSSIRPFAPNPKSIHGESPPFVLIDEAWSFDRTAGEALEAAVSAAMLTRNDKQLWIISAAGTSQSHLLLEYVAQGRAAVNDPVSDTAYFEWAAPSDDPDQDPAAFHPAYGHLIDKIAWQHERKKRSPANFRRNMLNRWSRSLETVFDVDQFKAAAVDPPDDVAIAFEIANDRSEAVIVAAWRDDQGRAYWKVVKSHSGTSWLPAAIREISKTLSYRALGADNAGATKSAIDDLASDENLDLQLLGVSDFATATGDVLELIRHLDGSNPDPQLFHDGYPEWIDEANNAVLRRLGQSQAWDRNNSRGPIPRIIAGTVALRLYDHGAPVAPDPMVRF